MRNFEPKFQLSQPRKNFKKNPKRLLEEHFLHFCSFQLSFKHITYFSFSKNTVSSFCHKVLRDKYHKTMWGLFNSFVINNFAVTQKRVNKWISFLQNFDTCSSCHEIGIPPTQCNASLSYWLPLCSHTVATGSHYLYKLCLFYIFDWDLRYYQPDLVATLKPS